MAGPARRSVQGRPAPGPVELYSRGPWDSEQEPETGRPVPRVIESAKNTPPAETRSAETRSAGPGTEGLPPTAWISAQPDPGPGRGAVLAETASVAGPGLRHDAA